MAQSSWPGSSEAVSPREAEVVEVRGCCVRTVTCPQECTGTDELSAWSSFSSVPLPRGLVKLQWVGAAGQARAEQELQARDVWSWPWGL